MKSALRISERGQTIVVAALLLPVLLGMSGMALDVGNYAAERRTLQNAADSIALAAGQELPDATSVQSAAAAQAAELGIDPADMSVVVSGGTTEPAVRVAIERKHQFSFVRAIGIDERDVGASAAAGKFSIGGGDGIVPWSIEQATVDGVVSGDEVVIKYDANGVQNGNFGVIRIDGSGSTDYEEGATYGADSVICSVATPACTTAGCPGQYPATCAEDSPECDGPECPPKTGNMTGPTRDAVQFRMDYTSSHCDTFDEVFTPLGDGSFEIDPTCNPWSGGSCSSTTALCSRRVFLIPIIDQFGNGSSDPVEIRGFALVYLEGFGARCTGNECEVRARFVRAELTATGFAATFDQGALVTFVKLTE